MKQLKILILLLFVGILSFARPVFHLQTPTHSSTASTKDIVTYVNGNQVQKVSDTNLQKDVELSESSDYINFTIASANNSQATIETDKRYYALGEAITFFFENADNETGQWIGIYIQDRVPGKNNKSTKWDNVTGTDGEYTFEGAKSVTSPGVYDAKIFHDSGYEILEYSELFYMGEIPVITTNKITYETGDDVKVTITKAPYLDNDWIAVYRKYIVPGTGKPSVKYFKVQESNSEYLFEGLPAGEYFATYLMQNKYFEPGERVYFKVTNIETALPTQIEAGELSPKIEYNSYTNELKINYESGQKELGHIYNLNGQLVMNFSFKNSISISTVDLKPGVYILHISNQVEKFIVY